MWNKQNVHMLHKQNVQTIDIGEKKFSICPDIFPIPKTTDIFPMPKTHN
jgi:hypothetical protein